MRNIFFICAILLSSTGYTQIFKNLIPEELRLGSKWTISEQEFKRNIKSVLIINVYTDSALIPPAFPGFEKNSFDNGFRTKFYDFINGKKDLVDKVVADAFNGAYKIKTEGYPIDNLILAKIKKEVRPLKDSIIRWPNNYDYSLNADYVKELIKKYSVDAVFFHYLQVYKDYEWYYWTEDRTLAHTSYYEQISTTAHSFILPIFKLEYKFIMYNKNGEKITRCPPLSPALLAKLKIAASEMPDVPPDTELEPYLETLLSDDNVHYYTRIKTIDEFFTKNLDDQFSKNIEKTLGRKKGNYLFNDLK
jgi:hypothetical protein